MDGSFRLAYGGLSVSLPKNEIGSLLTIPGVAAVQRDALQQPLDIQEPWQFVGSDVVWPSLGGNVLAGSNVLVGNLDTGVWPENPMLADNGIPAPSGGPYACEFGDGSAAMGATFTCNDKLVGTKVFLNTYLSVIGALPGEYCKTATGPCSARDSVGHGTHTLTTAGGDFVTNAPIFGIERGPVSGIAPGAHVISYRVCLTLGCFGSDSVAAVNQAIDDEVDVLNFSISGGNNAFTDPVELAFLDFYASGGLVNASAGNAGPGPATANHAGPWTNTVGASYPPRLYLTTLHLTATGGPAPLTFDAEGSSITPGISTPTDVIRPSAVAGYTGTADCRTPFAAGSVAGKVVACARGNPAGRNASAFNVRAGGGVGMILFNTTHQDLFTDNFWVPTVMLDGGTWKGVTQPSAALQAFLAAHTGVTATFETGVRTEATPDIMTTFSSRGPLGDWIKPDVTAPGIEILAGTSLDPAPVEIASGPDGENFQAIAGTSMSAPHATGVAALVKAVHPSWTPGQLKSALMTSSVQNVFQPDGTTLADPFNMGAGSIRVDRAVNPTLTFDQSAAGYAALAADPLRRIDANLPSINAPTFSGSVTTTRMAMNVTAATQSFTVDTTAPTGASITVKPSKFTIGPGSTRRLTITISGEKLAPNAQYFGSITVDAVGGANDVYIPVAFFKRQGVVTLSHTCTPTTFPVGTSSNCTVRAPNLAPVEAHTHVSARTPNPSMLKFRNIAETHNATSSGVLESGASGFDWDGTLSPAIAPTVDSITPGGLPFGYLPLRPFGVSPIGGMGDETIVNFGTSRFLWGDEPYERLGVTSNGYIVIGGGTSADVEFEPQTMPDPARPNNVIAPWWTDLDLSAGGGCTAATLCGARSATLRSGPPGGTCTDGVSDCWIIVDYENVPTFGAPSDRHDFQIWLGLNTDGHPAEDVTLAYGDVGTGVPGFTKAGAENRDGSSGINMSPLPGDNTTWTINTSPPVPGGFVTITYQARGIVPGVYDIPARMTSDQTAGTTTEVVTLHVTP